MLTQNTGLKPTILSSSDSELELSMAMLATCTVASTVVNHMSKIHTGSLLGRAGNRSIGRENASRRLDTDFFNRGTNSPPLFSESEFERAFRMPRSIYERIRERLVHHDKFFQQHYDAAQRLGASTNIKITGGIANAGRRMHGVFPCGVNAHIRVTRTALFEDLLQRCC